MKFVNTSERLPLTGGEYYVRWLDTESNKQTSIGISKFNGKIFVDPEGDDSNSKA